MTKPDDSYIFSIDLGPSGGKTALTTISGEVVDFEFQAVPFHLMADSGAEQNP